MQCQTLENLDSGTEKTGEVPLTPFIAKRLYTEFVRQFILVIFGECKLGCHFQRGGLIYEINFGYITPL